MPHKGMRHKLNVQGVCILCYCPRCWYDRWQGECPCTLGWFNYEQGIED
jgi:hypothetical protein